MLAISAPMIGALCVARVASAGTFTVFRRTYDYAEMLVRSGDAKCRPDPKQS